MMSYEPPPGEKGSAARQTVLVALAWIVVSGFFFVETAGSVGLAALAAVAAGMARRGDGRVALYAAVAAMVALLCAAPMVRMSWPVPALIAVGVGGLLSRWRLPGTGAWWRRGRIRPADLAVAAVYVLVPGTALWAWQALTHPDLHDLTDRFAGVPLSLYLLGAVGFSMANALAEEALFRGVAWQALAGVCRSAWAVLLFQAVSFGLLHIHGFPRGALGVALATVYGAMMGDLRRRTDGLLLPWIAHIFADCTIAAILYRLG